MTSSHNVAEPEGPRDSVDRFLDGWAQAQPDLDLSPVAVIQRLGRIRHIVDAEIEATFAEYGLNGSDYTALATVRLLSQEGRVSQRRLMRELGLTSGTVSLRVDRLTEQDLVTRSVDPTDRRNSLVALTEAGNALLDRATPAHLDTENRLLSALTANERASLVTLLRRLLVSFEGSASSDELPRLGLTLAPAHVTTQMRSAVGLPDVTGLLVRAVESDSRSANAGIRTGDVLFRAADQELRSITSLHAALRSARDELPVSLIRGVDTIRDVVLDLSPHHADDQTSIAAAAPDAGSHLI